MSNIFKPTTFAEHPNVIAALSLRDPAKPGGYSMLATNVSEAEMEVNRMDFAVSLRFQPSLLTRANQNHTNLVAVVNEDYSPTAPPQADALVSTEPGYLLGVTIADCVGIALYDPTHQAIAIVHSGRKGTIGKVAVTAVERLKTAYQTNPGELLAYVSPCPNANEYAIDNETAKACDPRYLSPGPSPNEQYYDNRKAVYDQLIEAGLTPEHIDVDRRSTIADQQFHSYRRDHDQAGRMMLAIGLKAT